MSGGFENKIWIFSFRPGGQAPITPTSNGPNTIVEAPFIDVTEFTTIEPSPRYNENKSPVYPTGLAISPDGNTLFIANNLDDSLGIVHDLGGARKLERVGLRPASRPEQFVYPYAVVAWSGIAALSGQPGFAKSGAQKIYVSCWNNDSVAAIDVNNRGKAPAHISVGQHPTAMRLNDDRSRLFVVNSGGDSVSVIDTTSDKEIERINVRLAEKSQPGNTPEAMALNGRTLYVANAHSNSVAVVSLSERSQAQVRSQQKREWDDETEQSSVRGFIPTGQYPSALAVARGQLFIGNGKGTGLENSSVVVNNSGRVPNAPNDRFPVGSGRGSAQGGEFSLAIVVGNISQVAEPDDPSLARYTQQVMRNNGLLGAERSRLFAGQSPIKHVIYVIRENRTYDQVLGDQQHAGNGMRADGDPRLAIFGAGDAAARLDGTRQQITPNAHALALRFGLFDRFFVNSEASPDGHNWSTAAFSSDYVDKAYRWDYSGRGRGYDYEGFNRLPEYQPVRNAPALFGPQASAEDVANFLRRFVPYLQGSRDVAEPATLYLWDAAARAGLTYRNYGEFIATLSEADINAIRTNRAKTYPDISPTVSAFATKKSLEGHFHQTFRNFDMSTPDAMTIESYRAAKETNGRTNPLITKTHNDERFRGSSRIGEWLKEFRGFVDDRAAAKTDRLPQLSIVRLSNDHTNGLRARNPTPQFYVADNDYALGLLVEAVSNSIYWKDTAIFVVEDDAQDGPDHVDAHRSVALVISAYNRPGLLVHEFHNTVSLIRTMELLLGIAPMNQLDATAIPMNIFRATPDLRPFKAQLPDVALDNLMLPDRRDAATAYWMKRTEEQDMAHQDMANPQVLNQIIWFSVRGDTSMPGIARLPVVDAMRLGVKEDEVEDAKEVARAERPRDKHSAATRKLRDPD